MKGSIWTIGDVQGCCAPLAELLAHPEIAGDTDSRFWFAGDLVNRGPQSLAVLRRIMAMGEALHGRAGQSRPAFAGGLRGRAQTLQVRTRSTKCCRRPMPST